MEFGQFKDRIAGEFGFNLGGYKEKQLKRRIDSLMASLGIGEYQQYFKFLKQDSIQWEKFLDRVTINVSEFFRNPEIFRQLEEGILPDLLKISKPLKIWSAACSNGAEPYSVAMILEDLTPRLKHKLQATDLDAKILSVAKQGLYDKNAVGNVSQARITRYFEPRDGKFQLKQSILEKVEFKRHDLLGDSFGRDYDLIICRNVIIYFTADAQEELYRKFREAMSNHGVLFIGATESIMRYQELGFSKISPWFYGKA